MKLYLSFLTITLLVSSGAFASPVTFTCESSSSPIRSSKGDEVVITAKTSPVEVLVVDKTKNPISKFGRGEMDGKQLSEPSFSCSETGTLTLQMANIKFSCLAMSVPEANRFSFDRELMLAPSIDGTLEGYLRKFTSDRPSGGATLYLWNCVSK